MRREYSIGFDVEGEICRSALCPKLSYLWRGQSVVRAVNFDQRKASSVIFEPILGPFCLSRIPTRADECLVCPRRRAGCNSQFTCPTRLSSFNRAKTFASLARIGPVSIPLIYPLGPTG